MHDVDGMCSGGMCMMSMELPKEIMQDAHLWGGMSGMKSRTVA